MNLTQISSMGVWVGRCKEGFYLTGSSKGGLGGGYDQGWSMYCRSCWTPHHTGLGGDKAVTVSDLCVGAKVDGWKLTSTAQYCPRCSKKSGVRIISAMDIYTEWWCRRVGGMAGIYVGLVFLYISLFTLSLGVPYAIKNLW